jgi:hypothetical protein
MALSITFTYVSPQMLAFHDHHLNIVKGIIKTTRTEVVLA